MEDEPSSDDAITSVREPSVTIVNAVPTGARLVVPIARIDEDFVFVKTGEGCEQRFSRVTGFEIQEGGAWSTWRLAGADFRRLRKKKQRPS